MPVIKWFLWRRWQFKGWIREYYYPHLIDATFRNNFASCRTHPIIHRDMEKIINANRPG